MQMEPSHATLVQMLLAEGQNAMAKSKTLRDRSYRRNSGKKVMRTSPTNDGDTELQ